MNIVGSRALGFVSFEVKKKIGKATLNEKAEKLNHYIAQDMNIYLIYLLFLKYHC